jgi:hypothetical protein
MTKRRVAVTSKSALDGTVEAYLIEHGGAPFVTTTHGKGKNLSSVTSPRFPDPLPTLAQAMRDFPCKGHGDRKPNVCGVAKKLARQH